MCVRDDRTMQSAEDICGEAALLHNPPQSQTAGADCSPRSALQPRCLIALWIYSSRIGGNFMNISSCCFALSFVSVAKGLLLNWQNRQSEDIAQVATLTSLNE